MPIHAIETEYKGDVCYVHVEIARDLTWTLGFVTNPGPRDTFGNRKYAERWVANVARRDPSLPLAIVEVDWPDREGRGDGA